MGRTGGHLRDLTADFLNQAASIVENARLIGVADEFREAAQAWQSVAAVALPDEVGDFVRLRELTSEIRSVVSDPASAGPSDAVAAELWDLRGRLDRVPPLDGDAIEDLLAALGASVARVYEVETAAVAHLRRIVALVDGLRRWSCRRPHGGDGISGAGVGPTGGRTRGRPELAMR